MLFVHRQAFVVPLIWLTCLDTFTGCILRKVLRTQTELQCPLLPNEPRVISLRTNLSTNDRPNSLAPYRVVKQRLERNALRNVRVRCLSDFAMQGPCVRAS